MTSAVLERDRVSTASPSDRQEASAPEASGPCRPRALLRAGAATWYGHDWWTVGRFIESTDDAYVGGDITVIAPKVAGFIAEVAVTDNQAVHAGDLLVKLDDRDYRAALARATAAVAGQQATLANLDATRRLQQAMIAQAEAEIAATEAEIARARVRLSTATAALDPGAVSPRCSASSRPMPTTRRRSAADQKARAARDGGRSASSTSSTPRSSRPRRLSPRRIADRDTAQLNLGYTELRAPIDGVDRQPQRPRRRLRHGGRPAHLAGAGRGPLGRCQFQGEPARRDAAGTAGAVKADVLPGEVFTAMSPASRRRPGRSSACCRRRTPRAISPRSSSACRCASCSTAMPRSWAACARASRSRSPWTSAAKGRK